LIPHSDEIAKAIAQTLGEFTEGEVLKNRANDISLEKAVTEYEKLLCFS
jgi:hypothetical protein